MIDVSKAFHVQSDAERMQAAVLSLFHRAKYMDLKEAAQSVAVDYGLEVESLVQRVLH